MWVGLFCIFCQKKQVRGIIITFPPSLELGLSLKQEEKDLLDPQGADLDYQRKLVPRFGTDI